MRKIINIFLLVVAAQAVSAQVGIGTNTPDNSAMLDVSAADKGILFPRLTSVQRAGIATPATGLHVFDTNTNSLWYFNGSVWINTAAEASLGDVKSGFQPNDHSGWLKLDGRSVNTLNANQQAAAIALGFTTNLPDASTAYLAQNSGTLGAVTGANTTTLTQANLPNVSFTGTAASAGGHNHGGMSGSAGGHNHTGTTANNGSHSHTGSTTDNGNHNHSYVDRYYAENQGVNQGFAGSNSGYDTDNAPFSINASTSFSGNHSHNLNVNTSGDHNHTFTTNSVSDHNHTIGTDGAHTHVVTVSSGGSASPINIAPKSLTVNMFVYLGY
jgi:hypothetical protein